MTAPASDVAHANATARIVAIDLARFVAVVGMMTAHLLSTPAWSSGSDDAATRAAQLAMGAANGNASTLFAVLAGVSMVLATRGLRARGAGPVLRSIAGRAVVLVGLGVVLSGLGPPVFVVLNYLGWAMLLASPLLLAPTWVVVTVGSVLWAVGGILNAVVRAWRFDGMTGADALAGSPLAPVLDLTVTGEYPAVTWVVLMAVGIVVARAVLAASDAGAGGAEAATRTREAHERSRAGLERRIRLLGVRLALVGALVATLGIVALRVAIGVLGDAWANATGALAQWRDPLVVGYGAVPSTDWWWQLADVPHTGSIADLARGVGVALVVLGAVLALVPTARRMPAILAPVRATGAAPLTIYALHVLVLLATYAAAWFVGADPYAAPPWWVAGFAALALHVAGAVGVGVLLVRSGTRGPLERMTSAVARAFAEPRGTDGAPR